MRARALEGEIIPPERARPVLFQSSPFDRGALKTLYLPEGASIADAVALLKVGPRLRRCLGVYLAEHRIEERHWARIRPKPGASLYIRVELKGDSGKDVLRAVLMIAVMVVAALAAPAIAGVFGLGGNVLATSLIQVGLITAGMMLTNALIPPPSASNRWGFDQQPGNPYASITGFRNQFVPYGPIPRVMGQKRMFPMVAARPYTEAQGKTQWLRLLLLVGYGPIDVSDIRIGNTPINVFAGSSWEVREGWPDDDPVTLYTRRIQEDPLSIFLEYNVYQQRQTRRGTEEVSVDITFPQGVGTVDPDDGKIKKTSVSVTVEWSANNGSSWNNADWIDPRGEWGTGTDGVITATDASLATQIRSGRFKVTGNADGVYLVRMRRTTPTPPAYVQDRSYWTALRSVQLDEPLNMSGLCVIALRLKATEQLNGVPDVINCMASAYHEVYDADLESWSYQLTRNPAWQATDLLRRRGNETMVADARIDLDAFVAWAAACDAQAPNAQEKRWTCDIVLEGGSVLSALQLICASGRAALSLPNGKYSIVRDIEQATPVAHISPRNSHSYRGTKAFIDVPHALRVTYINPDRDDQADEIVVYRDGYNADGSGGNTAASRFETLDLPTCRSAKQAWREARYHLAVLELRPEEHQVSQDIEALSCINGSLVRFSHDAVSIGIASGRIIALETSGSDITAITLDIEVRMLAELSYGVRVRHADLSTSVHAVDTDEGPTDTLTLTTPTPISGGPAVGDLVQFGESSLETAPMIVKRIARGDNLTARLTLVDAQSGVYTADAGTIPPFQSYINRTQPYDDSERPSRPVLSVRSDESALLRLGDGTLIERVEVKLIEYVSATVPAVSWEAEWRPSGANGDDNWRPVGQAPLGLALYLTEISEGDEIDVRARVISRFRVPSAWDYVHDHVVIGKTTAPDAPTGFAVAATLDGGKATWTPSSDVDVAGYELRYGGASWDAATVLGMVFGRDTKQAFHTIAISGGPTFRIKAVDVTGLYSTEVTAVATGQTNASGGVITDWRGLPTNATMGVAVVRSVAAPLSSSSSSSIQVAAHDVYLPGQTLSLPSDSITGLSTDTGYFIFWDRQASDYIAVTTNLETYYADTTGRYVAVGFQRTQDGGGGFTPPPPPPPGGGGGGGAAGGGADTNLV